MDEDVLPGVIAVDEAVARLDVEPLDRARHLGRHDLLGLLLNKEEWGKQLAMANKHHELKVVARTKISTHDPTSTKYKTTTYEKWTKLGQRLLPLVDGR